MATQRARKPTTPSRAGSGASRRPRQRSAMADLREAIAGHEDDVAGIALIVAAVLIALGVYSDFAGPVGHGIGWLAGVLVGVARYVMPPVLVLCGAAFVIDRRSASRGRLILGGVLATLSVLGLLHVARGPRLGLPVKGLRRAGGVVGMVAGRPLIALIAKPGAAVVLVGVLLVAVVLITRASLRTVGALAAKGVAAGVKPALGAARRGVREVTTLASERFGHGDAADEDGAGDGRWDVTGELPAHRTELYDGADDVAADQRAARAARKSKLPPPDPFALAPVSADTPTEQLAIDLGPGVAKGQWKLPSLDLLVRTEAQSIDMKAVLERGQELVKSLNSHDVGTKLLGQTVGPTVTRYELELEEGVKVARVTSLNKDIAYAMASADVRILAPIPGRKAIGVEVPNIQRHLVALGDLLASTEAKRATHPLEVAIGKDIAGRAVFLNLATTPHLLIAGATGAGKSSGLNCILTSILMRTTPDQVRLILIDPKRVEMGQYNRLPHLLTQVVTNPKKAANALQWAVKEMERRYDLLHEVGTRDITGYNAAFDRGELVAEPGSEKTYERLPLILVVVDELNDLMMVAARDVEDCITRIAQMARAVGLHLIIATQRPSVNVLTGVIKANIPARMAFAVSSVTDSRVILDQPGAERLVGKGDMLLLGPASSVAQRIQGAFVTEDEVRKVAAHWKRLAPEPEYVTGVEGSHDSGGSSMFGGSSDDEDDEGLVRQAMDLIVRSQLGSTSMLQRKLKVGFARAGRIMDLLEQRGVVGPSEGSKARAVLMSVEELEMINRAQENGD
jgi:DNA segregation ATPase FtsK/SpoIIIE, S-DNA-T family